MVLKDKFKFTAEHGEGRVYTAVRKRANHLHVTWEDDEHGWTYNNDALVEGYIRGGAWTIIDETVIEEVAAKPSEFDTLLKWCEEVGAKVTMRQDGAASLDIFGNVIRLEGWNHLKRLQPLVAEYSETRNKLIDVGFDL
jgi:hypothetical protein